MGAKIIMMLHDLHLIFFFFIHNFSESRLCSYFFLDVSYVFSLLRLITSLSSHLFYAILRLTCYVRTHVENKEKAICSSEIWQKDGIEKEDFKLKVHAELRNAKFCTISILKLLVYASFWIMANMHS